MNKSANMTCNLCQSELLIVNIEGVLWLDCSNNFCDYEEQELRWIPVAELQEWEDDIDMQARRILDVINFSDYEDLPDIAQMLDQISNEIMAVKS